MKYGERATRKDKNRRKNRIKRRGQARLVYVKGITRSIPTTWRWARWDCWDRDIFISKLWSRLSLFRCIISFSDNQTPAVVCILNWTLALHGKRDNRWIRQKLYCIQSVWTFEISACDSLLYFAHALVRGTIESVARAKSSCQRSPTLPILPCMQNSSQNPSLQVWFLLILSTCLMRFVHNE